jgi:hypothetical protein
MPGPKERRKQMTDKKVTFETLKQPFDLETDNERYLRSAICRLHYLLKDLANDFTKAFGKLADYAETTDQRLSALDDRLVFIDDFMASRNARNLRPPAQPAEPTERQGAISKAGSNHIADLLKEGFDRIAAEQAKIAEAKKPIPVPDFVASTESGVAKQLRKRIEDALYNLEEYRRYGEQTPGELDTAIDILTGQTGGSDE